MTVPGLGYLHAAGIDTAKPLVVAMDGREQITDLTRSVIDSYPQIDVAGHPGGGFACATHAMPLARLDAATVPANHASFQCARDEIVNNS